MDGEIVAVLKQAENGTAVLDRHLAHRSITAALIYP
jgi:hypothetical protein